VTTPRRILVVTNDFPPRSGGIESFVEAMTQRLPAADLVVHTSRQVGDSEYDSSLPYPVIRDPSWPLLPLPRVRNRIRETVRNYGCTSVWFAAAAPLGLLAPSLRSVGVRQMVATTHGHEVWWAATPGTRQLLGRIGRGVGTVTVLGRYTHDRIAPALGSGVRIARLSPGVDSTIFRPDVDGSPMRRRYGLGSRPVVVCVSRLVRRKGQDTLLAALPEIRHRVPDVAVLIVGQGPDHQRLTSLAHRWGVADSVVFTGAVPADELPAHYAAGNVFCMPCRNRRAGLEVEGLGMVFLEASATGLPVVAGDSGGAPDAVRNGRTGYVVNGSDAVSVAGRIIELLTDHKLARHMGEAGRLWVEASWSWDDLAGTLHELLRPDQA
jgi:phosphatidyl-myo-inositol dimannoside synthase